MSYAALEREQEKPRKARDWTERWEQLTHLLGVNGNVRGRVEAYASSKRISLEALTALGARVATYMTDRYRHLLDGQRERAAERLDAFLAGPQTGPHMAQISMVER